MLKALIKHTSDVKIDTTPISVKVSGKLGVLQYNKTPNLLVTKHEIDNTENHLLLTATITTRNKSLLGTSYALIKNMVAGVSRGHVARLELVGIGYKVNIVDNKIILLLGYSHPINIDIPINLMVTCPDATSIIIFGINKQEVSHFAVKLRALRKPEPYKGKGIRFFNEKIVLKAGKKK